MEDRLILRLPTGGYAPVFEAAAPNLSQPEPGADVAEFVPNPPAGISDFPTSTARSLAPSGSVRLLFGLVVVAILGAASIGLWRLLWKSAPAARGLVTPLTAYPGIEAFPSFAPDGQTIAFVWNWNSDKFNIYIKTPGQETPRRLTTSSAHDIQPAWSPDGKEIAFLRCWPEGIVHLIVSPASGGEERIVQVLHPQQGSWDLDASSMRLRPGVTWSTDGKHLVSSDRCGPQPGSPDCLYLFSKEGLERQRVTTATEGSVGDSLPAFSPDGHSLSYIRTGSQRQISEIFVRRMADGATHQVTFDGKTVSALAWLSKDRIAFVSNRAGGNRLWTAQASGSLPEAVSETGRSVGSFAVSSNGAQIVYSESFQNSNIWRQDLSDAAHSSPPIKLISSSGGNNSAAYSADGNRIAFMSDRSGTPEIWTADSNGANPTMLTSFPKATPVGSPRWSPDGTSLVFDSAKNGHSVILTIPTQAPAEPQVVADEAGDNMMPTWSHDGKSIYYLRRQTGTPAVWKKVLANGSSLSIAPDAASEAYESADGQSIFYVSNNVILQTSSAGRGNAKELVRDVTPSRYFAVAPQGIYFVPSLGDRVPRVEYYDFSNGKRHIVATMAKPILSNSPSLAISPDQKMLLYSEIDDSGADLMLLQLH